MTLYTYINYIVYQEKNKHTYYAMKLLTPHPSLINPHPSPLTPHPSPLTPNP